MGKSKKKKSKKSKRRNPYHKVLKELFKPQTMPNKKKQKNKNVCREKIKHGEAE